MAPESEAGIQERGRITDPWKPGHKIKVQVWFVRGAERAGWHGQNHTLEETTRLFSDLTDNLLLRDLKRRALREYGPHFNGFTVLEQGVAFGYLNRFFKAVCLNNPVTCDRLLGFRKRAVCHRLSTVRILPSSARLRTPFIFPSYFNHSNH